jgi:WD repeat-containing protein 48
LGTTGWLLKIQNLLFTQKFLIQAPDSFNYVISGGRDRRVFLTDLKQTDRQVLVCEEQYSVLRVVTTPDQQSMWVATTDSTIKNWVFILVLFN